MISWEASGRNGLTYTEVLLQNFSRSEGHKSLDRESNLRHAEREGKVDSNTQKTFGLYQLYWLHTSE